jgi:signal transduction histidine kinase
MKREKLVKFEISTHNKIVSPTSKFDKNKSRHNLHKVFLNSFSLFSKSFEEYGVKVMLQQSNIEAFFDYQSMTVALTHLLNNALKYSSENSEFRVSFRESSATSSIIFDMVSLRITDEDEKKIFDEGYSGEEARKANFHGQGVGMWMANYIVSKNKGAIKVSRDVNKSAKRNIQGRLYENNIFEISLPKPKD